MAIGAIAKEIGNIAVTVALRSAAGAVGPTMSSLMGDRKFGMGMITSVAMAALGSIAQGISESGELTAPSAKGVNLQPAENSQMDMAVDAKKTCVSKALNEPIDKIVIYEDPDFVARHGSTTISTTRYEKIFVKKEKDFWNDSSTVLEEYYHVTKQWRPEGRVFGAKYLAESAKQAFLGNESYLDNKYEVAAKNWVRENIQNYYDCLSRRQ
jgi:hypothetical protein